MREPGSTVTNQFGTWTLAKPIVRTRNYPPDDELVALMAELHSFNMVAQRVGVRRESLRDYLRVRPELNARMRAHLHRPFTEAEKLERQRAASREHRRLARLAEPNTIRVLRRLSMAGYKQPGKKPAIDPAMNDYARILRRDPCAYCGGAMGDIDHIVPVRAGGGLGWDNLTAACSSCNRRKRTRSLLRFLTERG